MGVKSWIQSVIDIEFSGNMDILTPWNTFVTAFDNMIGTADDVHLLSSKISIVNAVGSFNVPTNVEVKFIGGLLSITNITLDIYDFLIACWCIRKFPIAHVLTVIPLPWGLIAYMILRDVTVPYSSNFPQSGDVTKFGGLTDGFTVKDILWDIVKADVLIWLVKNLGQEATQAAFQAFVAYGLAYHSKKQIRTKLDAVDANVDTEHGITRTLVSTEADENEAKLDQILDIDDETALLVARLKLWAL